MSVIDFPPRPVEERVIRYAVAALIATQKPTRRALSRCRRRRSRALGLLVEVDGAGEAPDDDPAVVYAAAQWLQQGCRVCGLCPGVGVMPRPPPQWFP